MPIAFPQDPKPMSVTWTPKNAVAKVESPFTFAQKVYAWPGQAWAVSIEMPPMGSERLKSWLAFLVQLKSGGESFLFGPPIGRRGFSPGIPKFVARTPSYILTAGWPANTKEVLKAGDWLSIDNQLYMLIENQNSDARGQAKLKIWPDLHAGVSKDALIECQCPQGTFRLSGDVDLPTVGLGGNSSAFTIAATQDF